MVAEVEDRCGLADEHGTDGDAAAQPLRNGQENGPDTVELGAERRAEAYAAVERLTALKTETDELDGQVTAALGASQEDARVFWRWLNDQGGVAGRKVDMVISGGVNIYPAEIEAALAMMPGVRDCAVFGIPDEEFGEALCAAVQGEPGGKISSEDVQDYLKKRLADYKIPKRVTFHDELPREESGKIFKRRLRAPYWEKAGRKI